MNNQVPMPNQPNAHPMIIGHWSFFGHWGLVIGHYYCSVAARFTRSNYINAHARLIRFLPQRAPPSTEVFTHFPRGDSGSMIRARMVQRISNWDQEPVPMRISIGILAWNEEEAIGPALASLFRQSLFAELKQRQARCEIVCVANGCTDRTAAVATEIFQHQSLAHSFNDAFSCRSLHVPERGKNNACNLF